jgi:hypothetical protein
MKFFSYCIKTTFLLLCLILSTSCSDDEDCTKTITIPQVYFVNGQSYSYDIEQEVSCDVGEPEVPTTIEMPVLENFDYQVVDFGYIADTGNNNSRLFFEITIINNNDFSVNGFPFLTLESDGLTFGSADYAQDAISPCLSLDANSTCSFIYDNEFPIDPLVGTAGSIQFVKVEYLKTN